MNDRMLEDPMDVSTELNEFNTMYISKDVALNIDFIDESIKPTEPRLCLLKLKFFDNVAIESGYWHGGLWWRVDVYGEHEPITGVVGWRYIELK